MAYCFYFLNISPDGKSFLDLSLGGQWVPGELGGSSVPSRGTQARVGAANGASLTADPGELGGGRKTLLPLLPPSLCRLLASLKGSLLSSTVHGFCPTDWPQVVIVVPDMCGNTEGSVWDWLGAVSAAEQGLPSGGGHTGRLPVPLASGCAPRFSLAPLKALVFLPSAGGGEGCAGDRL